jgi:hypothetical protein
MHYSETISTVRFVAGLMSEMLATYYDAEEPGGERPHDDQAPPRPRRGR